MAKGLWFLVGLVILGVTIGRAEAKSLKSGENGTGLDISPPGGGIIPPSMQSGGTPIPGWTFELGNFGDFVNGWRNDETGMMVFSRPGG